MDKVYIVSCGQACIAHRFGASNFNRESIVHVFNTEEKVHEYIRKNITFYSELGGDIYTEFPVIDEIRESTRLVFARNSDDYSTEYLYYIYESHNVE